VGWIHRLIHRTAKPSLRERMEAESRQWICRCLTCGNERSVWEMGGVRYKAAGRSRALMRCPKCERLRCHLIYWGGPKLGAPSEAIRKS
jgi:hypothetical protein